MTPPAPGVPAAPPGCSPPASPASPAVPGTPATDLPAPGPAVVHVGLGQRTVVVGDLLLGPNATASSTALAGDLAATLDRWVGPGTVVVCGNLLAGGAAADGDGARAALAAHPALAGA
ncbi:MAG: hypothetical protein ACRDZR_14330, partial [Acidimicrobiales bacterium]